MKVCESILARRTGKPNAIEGNCLFIRLSRGRMWSGEEEKYETHTCKHQKAVLKSNGVDSSTLHGSTARKQRKKTAYNNIHKIRDPNSFHVRRNGVRIASSKIRPCRNDRPSNILGHLLYLDQRNFPMTAMVDRHGPIHHLIRNICVALKRFT